MHDATWYIEISESVRRTFVSHHFIVVEEPQFPGQATGAPLRVINQ